MDLESFTRAAYYLVDEVLAALASDPDWHRLRQRGPAPMLADGEVLTMAVMSEFLDFDQDVAIYHYFLRHHPGWFPGLQRGGWRSSRVSPWFSPSTSRVTRYGTHWIRGEGTVAAAVGDQLSAISSRLFRRADPLAGARDRLPRGEGCKGCKDCKGYARQAPRQSDTDGRKKTSWRVVGGKTAKVIS